MKKFISNNQITLTIVSLFILFLIGYIIVNVLYYEVIPFLSLGTVMPLALPKQPKKQPAKGVVKMALNSATFTKLINDMPKHTDVETLDAKYQSSMAFINTCYDGKYVKQLNPIKSALNALKLVETYSKGQQYKIGVIMSADLITEGFNLDQILEALNVLTGYKAKVKPAKVAKVSKVKETKVSTPKPTLNVQPFSKHDAITFMKEAKDNGIEVSLKEVLSMVNC